MKSIRVFDIDQYRDAREQAASMRGSDQPLSECIEFGRMWAKIGLAFARQDYEAARDIRKRVEEARSEAARARRKLEKAMELEESA